MKTKISSGSFIFHEHWAKILATFPEAVRNTVMNAILLYVATGDAPEIDDIQAHTAFLFIRAEIDAFREANNPKPRQRATKKNPETGQGTEVAAAAPSLENVPPRDSRPAEIVVEDYSEPKPDPLQAYLHPKKRQRLW